MQGRIIRGVGGFYYVHVPDEGVYECRARGIFRKEKIRPLVGDRVRIHITDPKDMEGSLDEILPRRNQLIRPAAANVDQALVVFAAASPEPNLNLLDRFLINMKNQGIACLICINKTDLVTAQKAEEFVQVYAGSGVPLLTVSVKSGLGLEEVAKRLRGKTTVVAGPSGVGKSSLTNALCAGEEQLMEVGEVSRKIGRGRHTTRHTQLFYMGEIGPDTYFLDTPGFSSLDVFDVESRDLQNYYEEFAAVPGRCRFLSCMHISEPDCAVKDALEKGVISRVRYENYVQLAGELKRKEDARYR